MTELADQSARTQAWQCFDQSIAVTAGAGTGKTRVLVDRFLAWCLAEGWTRETTSDISKVLGSILAITFTEKAAGEMEERIVRSLQQIIGEEVSDLSTVERQHVDTLANEIASHWSLDRNIVTERASMVLAHTHRLEVSTIHAFAMRLLRTWPIEAGIHPDFQVDADGRATQKLVHRCFVQKTRMGLKGPNAEQYAELLARFGSDGLEALLQAWVNSGFDGTLPQPPKTEPFAGDCRFLLRSLDVVAEEIPKNSQKKFERVCASLAIAAVAIETHSDALATDTRGALAQSGLDAFQQLKADLKSFPSKTIAAKLSNAPEVHETAGRLHQFVSEALLADPESFSSAAELYMPLVETMRKQLTQAGWLSYDDLLRITSKLLKTQHIADSVACRYGQLLVDEFQDTDSEQCDILNAIANADSKQPKLFVVGDPKQSIYSFRRADLNAYEKFTTHMTLHLSLTTSFRTQDALLKALNGGFEQLFVRQEGLQPAPQSLIASRSAIPDYPAIQMWFSENKDGGRRLSAEARQLEARAVVKDILERDNELEQNGHARWSRYAILSRVQSQAAIYAEELSNAGIPYIISGDKTFFSQQEVVDAVNLLRVLVDAADSLAWVGLLRSPIGALPDPLLVDLANANFFASGGHVDTIKVAMDGARGMDRVHLGRLLTLSTVLENLRETLWCGEIDEWLGAIESQLPVPDVYAAQYRGEYKTGNFMRIMRDFCHAAQSDAMPLGDWLDEVVQNVEVEANESESALADDTTDAVRIMSIHASKGLQFDHVFMPYLDWNSLNQPDKRPTITHTTNGWVTTLDRWATWGISAVKAQQKKVQEAEAVRIFYVGCTRSRNSLTLMGKKSSGLSGLARQSFIDDAIEHVTVEYLDDIVSPEVVQRESTPPLNIQKVLESAPSYWQKRQSALLAKNPNITTATAESKHQVTEQKSPQSHSGGAELGTEVHELLEAWENGHVDLTNASPEANTLVSRFLDSELNVRMKRANRLFKELPFVYSPEGAATVVGTIDLVLETDEGWIIVDYKTHWVNSQDQANKAAIEHQRQGELYMAAVRHALGIAPLRFELWFLRGPWTVSYPWSA